ncbi:putative periplasmic serine endoprotease DegP-like [Rubrivivax sp. A210]|uniref:DegQ family serine endoprotease n=1 Tax=Rubrivivax sp. A210 TaxID=2772301 RepID=UPI0019B5DEC5|nr:DegQ family serine endoprotease [Rubrivivax sp. A210]CAD5370653.1 putative periplasmic serine endoprotease DegP-like [Rubrivivax sp. A210]
MKPTVALSKNSPWARRGALMLAALLLAATALLSLPGHAQTVQLPDFTELVERVGPSVVNIRTTEKRAGGNAAGETDPNIEEFFRRFGIPMPGRPDPRRGNPRNNEEEAPQQRGVGSGFILSADGYIMTNAHVVDGADEVIVTLTDKRELKARIIGADKRSDVAVVKVEASGLPFVKIGDVNRLKVGEWVMAIGSPFGLDNTVTAGIVSAKQRDTGDFLPLIQTDVAINPGNSGGPLINLRGEVVGINSQIYSRSGGFMGISFAIPIDEAQRVSEQLRANGRVIRGRIGVQIGPVSKEVAESIGLGQPRGALVNSVEKDGPADKAGVEAGDIIVKVDGRAVEKSGDLPRIIGGLKPGSKATLQIFRRGAAKDLGVGIAEFEADRPNRRAAADPATPPATAKSVLGLTVSDLTDAQKKELRVRGGVRIDAVDGAAARAGLREGDVILSLDNADVVDSRQFAAATAKVEKAKSVSVLVRRGEWTNYFVIRPGK